MSRIDTRGTSTLQQPLVRRVASNLTDLSDPEVQERRIRLANDQGGFQGAVGEIDNLTSAAASGNTGFKSDHNGPVEAPTLGDPGLVDPSTVRRRATRTDENGNLIETIVDGNNKVIEVNNLGPVDQSTNPAESGKTQDQPTLTGTATTTQPPKATTDPPDPETGKVNVSALPGDSTLTSTAQTEAPQTQGTPGPTDQDLTSVLDALIRSRLSQPVESDPAVQLQLADLERSQGDRLDQTVENLKRIGVFGDDGDRIAEELRLSEIENRERLQLLSDAQRNRDAAINQALSLANLQSSDELARASLTGTLGGEDTLAGRQLGLSEASLFGQDGEGRQTLAAQSFEEQKSQFDDRLELDRDRLTESGRQADIAADFAERKFDFTQTQALFSGAFNTLDTLGFFDFLNGDDDSGFFGRIFGRGDDDQEDGDSPDIPPVITPPGAPPGTPPGGPTPVPPGDGGLTVPPELMQIITDPALLPAASLLLAAYVQGQDDAPATTAVASTDVEPAEWHPDVLEEVLQAVDADPNFLGTGVPVTREQVLNGEVSIPDFMVEDFAQGHGLTFDEVVGNSNRRESGSGTQIGFTQQMKDIGLALNGLDPLQAEFVKELMATSQLSTDEMRQFIQSPIPLLEKKGYTEWLKKRTEG